jgi:hypothetical protein
MSSIDCTQCSNAIAADPSQVQFHESSKVPNEILDLIFAAVPIEYKASMRRVSRGRKDFIDKIGYHVDPIRIRASLFRRYHSGLYIQSIPCYPASIKFQQNPVVGSYRDRQARRFPGGLKSDGVLTRNPRFRPRCMNDRSMLLLHRIEFINNPPITMLEISCTKDRAYRAILRVAGGIRVCHLLELTDKIIATNAMNPRRASYTADQWTQFYSALRSVVGEFRVE